MKLPKRKTEPLIFEANKIKHIYNARIEPGGNYSISNSISVRFKTIFRVKQISEIKIKDINGKRLNIINYSDAFDRWIIGERKEAE